MNGLLRGVLLVAVFQVGCGPGAIMGPIDAGAGGGTAGGTGGSAGGSAGGVGGGSAGGVGGGSAGGAGGGSAGGTGGAAGGSAGGTGGTGGTGGGAPPVVTPGGPVLFFSDLVNAPRTGNSDTSKGQTANADGAFVTVWGKRLGATQGTSTVTVGGVAARVYSWGPATKPANLSVRMGLDMIELQIPGTAPLGAAPIVVTVNGTASNPLDFTTRATGKISFVAQTGSDSNPGTFAAPWKTFDKVASSIGNGDVAYLMDGFVDTTDSIDNACIGLNSDGAPGAPKALAAYPGATAKVSGTCGGVGAYSYSLNRDTKHWVISKLTIDSTGVTDTLMTLSSGYRAVGNSISNPHTSDGCQSGTVGCGGLGPCGDDIFFLGNEIKNVMQVNQATGSKQCHTVYISGDRQHNGVEKNRDIGWNYIHDCYDNRAINIYNESFNGASGQRVQIENHRVHDNWIENHRGVGILMGLETTGDNLIYNNVLINTGFGPDWSEGISGHFPLQLNPGSPQNARPSTLRVFHNTIKGTGFASNPGLIYYEPASATTFELKNNVVVSTSSTIPYLSPDSVTLAAGMNRNLWFGAGAKPAFDSNGVSGDPKFTSTTDFHLGAGSAAKSAATPLPNAPLDFDGIPRSATTPSIGAFE